MNYDPKSSHAEEFIHHGEIEETLAYGEANRTNRELIDEILAKARERRGLTHREAMVLLDCRLEDKNQEIYELAEQIKKGFLRKPHRAVCASVPVQLLHQRVCVLSLPRQEQAYPKEEADTG